MLGLSITNLDIFYYNKKPPSPQFNTKTILGGGVHMNDLNKILCIYDVKVNVNCVKDDDISFFVFYYY